MKKLNLAAAACLMATLAMAQTNEVTSVNVVGYYKLTIASSGRYSMAAINLDSIDPTNQNLMGIFGTQLRSGALAGLGDRIYLFDPVSDVYNTFQRKTSDGLYHNTANFSGAATNPSLTSGQGFWLRSASSATTNYDVVVMGEVVGVMTQSMDLVPGYQLAGYPFSTDVPVNSTKLGATGKTGPLLGVGDRIYIWNGSSYVTLGLWTNRMWYTSSAFGGANPPATNVIPMGGGFWYRSASNGVSTWSETNSYIGNL